MNRNPNCGGSHCAFADGPVRVLPTGGQSNAILCRSCFEHEMRWRKERNRELGTAYQFKLPDWGTLEVYK